jgi:hypothetical protein
MNQEGEPGRGGGRSEGDGGSARGWPGRSDGFFTWLAHDDAGAAVVAALALPAGTYNVAEDEPLRRSELAEGLARILGGGRGYCPGG